MSDQSALVAMPNTFNLDEVRATWLVGMGKVRLMTVARLTAGPATMGGGSDLVTCDTTGAGYTVNLPLIPVDGDTYEVFKEVAANTLTIGRNGQTINFVAANDTMTAALSCKRFTWSAAANTWLVRTFA